MKSKRSIALLALIITLALIPAVLAQPNMPLRCDLQIELGPSGWFGNVSGSIEGTITIVLLDAVFPGITEHYWEVWTIVTSGGTITIYQAGVWSFKSFKFKSNGYVTAATGTWEYLEGARVHTRGLTTDLDADPITGDGKFWICGRARDRTHTAGDPESRYRRRQKRAQNRVSHVVYFFSVR
jgi:hypothetical protein